MQYLRKLGRQTSIEGEWWKQNKENNITHKKIVQVYYILRSKYVRLAAQIVLIHYNKVEETECVRWEKASGLGTVHRVAKYNITEAVLWEGMFPRVWKKK